MKLLEKLNKILNESFENQIPDWRSLSPFDPMKVFAEGVLGALVEIENLSRQRTRRILDQIPALFGFPARGAIAPSGYFQFVPSELLNAPLTLEEGSEFQFTQGDTQWNISPCLPVELTPLILHSVTHENTKRIVKLKSIGSCSSVILTYLPPEHSTPGQISQLQRFSIYSRSPYSSELKEIPSSLVEVSYSSLVWTQPVQISLSPSSPENGFKFNPDTEYQLIWEFESKEIPEGLFYTNLFLCEITRLQEETILGHLKGEAWEEIPLPLDLIHPPETLDLIYPNEKTRRLNRIQDDILKWSAQDPSRLLENFIYDPLHHCLILPAGFELVQQFLGGISVILPQQVLFPVKDWVPSEAKLQFTGFRGMVETILPLRLKNERILRETAVEYLDRFYNCFRQFMSIQEDTHRTHLIHWNEIQLKLLSISPSLGALELVPDDSNATLKIYGMNHPSSCSPSGTFSSELQKQVEQAARKVVPIHYSWKLESFQPKPIQVILELQIEVSHSERAQFQLDLFKKEVQKHLSLLFYPKALRVKIQSEEILDLLRYSIESHPKFLKGSVLFLDSESGEVLDELERKVGQFISPTFQITVSL